MSVEIDCRGLACPAPVLQTKEAIEAERPDIIQVTVDNEASAQNVIRFLESRGFAVTVEKDGSHTHVLGRSEGASDAAAPSPAQGDSPDDKKKIMVLVTDKRMGRGDDGLGKKLMISFLTTLKEMGDELWRLVFLNNGVKLTIEGARVLPVLKAYEETGLHILVCGTCLTHFDLLERKRVGETTNMLDIVTAMQLADEVITL